MARLSMVSFLVLAAFQEVSPVSVSNPSQTPVNDSCPLPPYQIEYKERGPRTALASHPRAGSTWLRFLIERATGLPCGVERAFWANVLRHVGEDAKQPEKHNVEGIVVKTHSVCHGCWKDADKRLRLSLAENTSVREANLRAKLGDAFVDAHFKHGTCMLYPPKPLQRQLVEKGMHVEELLCLKEYERAVILYRDPLDAILLMRWEGK